MATIDNRGELLTEGFNPDSAQLDQLSTIELVDVINRNDAQVAEAVAVERQAIAKAIDLIAVGLQQGGRLFYVGAGTSGRLGVLDAVECPPTFQTSPEQVIGIIAGGAPALTQSAEGKEDDHEAGAQEIAAYQLGKHDTVVGIAAGGTTPYVHGALDAARSHGAKTVFLACVPESQVPMQCDVSIRPLVGPEVISGSTRMKAGTATKLVLNSLSTGVMVQLGKVYGNMMVDVAVTNNKLLDRGLRIVEHLTSLNRDAAALLLEAAHKQVKPALLMYWLGCDFDAAIAGLEACHGNLRSARNQLSHDRREENPAGSPTQTSGS